MNHNLCQKLGSARETKEEEKPVTGEASYIHRAASSSKQGTDWHPGDATVGAAGSLVGTLEQDRISRGMGRGHHLLSASVCVHVPAVQEISVQFLGQEAPLEKG